MCGSLATLVLAIVIVVVTTAYHYHHHFRPSLHWEFPTLFFECIPKNTQSCLKAVPYTTQVKWHSHKILPQSQRTDSRFKVLYSPANEYLFQLLMAKLQ